MGLRIRPPPRPLSCRMISCLLAELQSRLSSVQAEQAAIARHIAEIESPEVPVVSEAEAVARAAQEENRKRTAHRPREDGRAPCFLLLEVMKRDEEEHFLPGLGACRHYSGCHCALF